MELHARRRLAAKAHEGDIHAAVAEIGKQLRGVALGKRERDVRIILPISANQLRDDRVERALARVGEGAVIGSP